MRKEHGGSGTPFGYTDPDLYEQRFDKAYDLYIVNGVTEKPTEGAVMLLVHWAVTGQDLSEIRNAGQREDERTL